MSNDNDNMDYEVGYKRPPKEHQFKSGISGNPKGRPKPSKTIGDAIKKDLKSTIKITENGKQKKMSKLDAAGKKITNMLLMGDINIIKIFLKELYNDISLDYEIPPVPESEVYTKEEKHIYKKRLIELLDKTRDM